MGKDAEQMTMDELDNQEPVEEPKDAEAVDQEDGEPGSEDTGESKAQAPEEDEEFDVVIDGESQPEKAEPPRRLTKRFGKLVKQREEANTRASGAEDRARIAEERAELYRLQIEQMKGGQQPQAVRPPNPDDFDGGVHDPAYITGFNEYLEKKNEALVAKRFTEETSKRQESEAQKAQARSMEKAIEAHYERAANLKVKDYEAAEDKVVSVLGEDATRVLINVSDKSEQLIYFFSKNPDELDRFAAIAERDAGRALFEIGRLQSQIKLKPKSHQAPPPDPDEELEGGALPKKGQRGPRGAKFY